MEQAIILIVFLLTAGCADTLTGFEQCVGKSCERTAVLPEHIDVSIHKNVIPTTNGGSVMIEKVSSLKLPANSTFLGAGLTEEKLLAVLQEDLGGNILRLRTREVQANGVFGDPLCDRLISAKIDTSLIFVAGEFYYIYERLNYGTAIRQYSLQTCQEVENSVYTYSIYSLYSSPFAVTDHSWLVVNDQTLQIFSRQSKLKTQSLSEGTKGSGKLAWNSFVTLAASANVLWVHSNGKIWKIDLDTMAIDWFQLPFSDYSCLNRISELWTNNDKLQIVCLPDTTAPPQMFTFDTKQF